jgi:2'-5' RNA ligase
MRLFVAVRPPEHLLNELETLPRPSDIPARWTTREQWHVTLRFLGNVDDPAPVIDALDATRESLAPVDVTVGPRAAVLGRQVVYLPVAGLDVLADVIIDATRNFGEPPPARPFKGHLTLARTKGAVVDRSSLDLAATWTVDHVELIRSHLGRGPARYETLAALSLGG